MRVLVLFGGGSPEREVSNSTARAVRAALESRGHQVFGHDPAGGAPAADSILAALREHEPDVVFIAFHGGEGENGTVQAMLELAGVPYTGSGILSSAMVMDKLISKRLFASVGLPTPEWEELDSSVREPSIDVDGIQLPFPVVVKPAAGGSTIGIGIARSAEELPAAIEGARAVEPRIFVEAYVPGREMTVAVLDGRPLPAVEIVPESGFYDYEAKYTKGRSEYVVPAEVSTELAASLAHHAVHAYMLLRCAGCVRVDFRVDANDQPWCLEVNSIPGMTETSLVPMAARAAGIEFPELIERLCRLALSE